MDHCWTPNKNRMNCDSIVMLSPITKTPVRQNDGKFRSSFQSSTSSFSVLPNHITPPSGLTKFIARNPFEADLTNKLHISVISPSVFSKISSPAQRGSSGFTWSIDEIALIQPAKIDEYPTQQMHCSDPEMEKNAQEAISKFFNENQIIPSPCDIKRNECKSENGMQTPIRVWPETDSSKESNKSKAEKKESWTQTVLTLPPELPPIVEEALRPYFNFTQEQNGENEEANTSNSSLRRKLFANHDDSHNESIDSNELSPVKPRSSSSSPSFLSPPQSGMFFHGTPLRNGSQIIQRTYGTPLTHQDSSPCDVSPISNPGFNMSCQSIKSRNKSVARLDFTKDMSIEVSIEEEKDSDRSSVNENICKTLFSEEMKIISESVRNEYSTGEERYYDVTQMMISSENSVKLKCNDKETHVSSTSYNTDKRKFVELGKMKFSESYAMQQSNMLSGNYVPQMTCNSAQDTGYQTHSSSNIMVSMDSCSTSIKQKLHWDERITQVDDEVQLADWRENMKNMISSTPSKFIRGLSNL